MWISLNFGDSISFFVSISGLYKPRVFGVEKTLKWGYSGFKRVWSITLVLQILGIWAQSKG
jgi:hypothetical protein